MMHRVAGYVVHGKTDVGHSVFVEPHVRRPPLHAHAHVADRTVLYAFQGAPDRSRSSKESHARQIASDVPNLESRVVAVLTSRQYLPARRHDATRHRRVAAAVWFA